MRGSGGTRGDGLLVLESGFAQMHMHVHQSGDDAQPAQINAFGTAVRRLADGDDPSVRDRYVGLAEAPRAPHLCIPVNRFHRTQSHKKIGQPEQLP